jgi:hypothetical protein
MRTHTHACRKEIGLTFPEQSEVGTLFAGNACGKRHGLSEGTRAIMFVCLHNTTWMARGNDERGGLKSRCMPCCHIGCRGHAASG